MPFREKSAWVMAALMTAAGAIYVWGAVTASRVLGQAAPPLAPLISFIMLVVIGAIVLQVALAILWPREADSPADERERLIQTKAGAWAGWVLTSGVLAGLAHFLVNGDGTVMFHILFVALIVSQVAEYAFAIFLFRRGV